ncbi:TPA: hypothetical protein ACGO1T_000673 [Streptococcus suis]
MFTYLKASHHKFLGLANEQDLQAQLAFMHHLIEEIHYALSREKSTYLR